jgi:KDO2-lipid IV(A) lauroyltransferase
MYFIGRPLSLLFARFAAFMMFYFIPIRKKDVIGGLRLAFPQKSLKEIKKIALAVYNNFTAVFVDFLFIPKMPVEKLDEMLIYDRELIERTLAQGKGLVLLSAHYGNWELSALSFAKKYQVALIVPNQSNGYVDRMLNEFRTQEGFHIINFNKNERIAFRGIVEALKKNKVLAILGDQDAGHLGLFIPFFGHIASTPKGPAVFALAAKSPIITAFGCRQKDGSMKMKTEILPIPNTGNREEDIKIINTIYYQRLEEVIREHPEQWFWFHRRWKSRPRQDNIS